MKTRTSLLFCALLAALTLPVSQLAAQTRPEVVHKRGTLWENEVNNGFIGSLGAWDFQTSNPLGLYPGFDGYYHMVGGEQLGYENGGFLENANMHNFRSGLIIAGKDFLIPGDPPDYVPVKTDYEVFYAGLQADPFGVESVLPPMTLIKNYQEAPGFNPALPEEMSYASWNTNFGITVTRRSYVWNFPGYSDFIIYDYTMKNTGLMVSTRSGALVPNFPPQVLPSVFFAFHSGIAVSTKSQINFHMDLEGVAAGGFGWHPSVYHDFYSSDDDGTLNYSYNYNGGAAPPPWDNNRMKPNEIWKQFFGNELESPSAFGWLALYGSPAPMARKPRVRPEGPDVLRIDTHKGGDFPLGQPLDLEQFNLTYKPKSLFYRFCSSPDLTGGGKAPNNGQRMNFFTYSYGPYVMNPGDSLRFVIAEIAGVMNYKEAVAGDPLHHFPDSTIAAIRRNAANARNAVKWGMGASVNGINLAAAVPVPPPAPAVNAVNGSKGGDTAAIAITWDKAAETGTVTDGRGNLWYHGASDLKGYRIYRSSDFQYVSGAPTEAFRAAWWDLVADIPAADLPRYFDASLGKYKFTDYSVFFGFRYGYYVSAYWTPASWTAPNGTVVTGLGEVASGPVNKTLPTRAAPGPVQTMDVFVAPNPFVWNDPNRSFVQNGNRYGVEFRNLPEACTIRIYTIGGDLVKTLEHKVDALGNKFGSEPWDQKSDSGLLVAPGLYVYHVSSTTPGFDRVFTGKLMIIR